MSLPPDLKEALNGSTEAQGYASLLLNLNDTSSVAILAERMANQGLRLLAPLEARVAALETARVENALRDTEALHATANRLEGLEASGPGNLFWVAVGLGYAGVLAAGLSEVMARRAKNRRAP